MIFFKHIRNVLDDEKADSRREKNAFSADRPINIQRAY